ncbi:MAG: AbrB/MazE/SpoVT family DNA-binding domain-containing protein [Actinomycetota bacterium]|nr:AbrB/MazE/SpoVT family DNA-binding domain-containing protein [Actinomycetota bacterium]MDI6821520.1 AbrB/MazE/SpoVT family DNA-binding domain-containing protein [Actinomycetota bacterium]
MKLKIRRVGNSLTVTIPKDIAGRLNIKPASEVDVEIEGDRIVLSKVKSQWDELVEKTRQKAKEMGLKEEDINRALSEIRYGR